MPSKPVRLVFVLALMGAVLIPGIVLAHGDRGWDYNRYWDQRGHRACDRCDWRGRGHHKHRHSRGYSVPRAVYRDRWGYSRGPWSGVTVIYSGRGR